MLSKKITLDSYLQFYQSAHSTQNETNMYTDRYRYNMYTKTYHHSEHQLLGNPHKVWLVEASWHVQNVPCQSCNVYITNNKH